MFVTAGWCTGCLSFGVAPRRAPSGNICCASGSPRSLSSSRILASLQRRAVARPVGWPEVTANPRRGVCYAQAGRALRSDDARDDSSGSGSGGGGGGSGSGSGGGDGDDATPPAPRLPPLMALVEAYTRQVRLRPIRTKALSTGIINFLADAVAQWLEARHSTDGGDGFHWNARRSLSFGAIGLLYVGPALHGWFAFLERLLPAGRWVPLAKLALDQLGFAVVINTSLLWLLAWMEGSGGGAAGAWRLARPRIKPTLLGNWRVWPAAQLVNFTLIPPAFQVLYINFISFGWTIYLSELAHASPEESGQSGKRKAPAH
ncbi:hypothetical protein CDCA_CDCA17G4423 [Cyanidium caldarium]|uniref:Uncharacterized protein n=1 Tax=Cyanidium caldarium TaxID=2771 RepID=A0AAV9J2W9_CYACA|nr:hypothetical protein CDCA_CDCA17G4423 [Cyanidium caldarium]